jgi:Caspase domain
MVGKGFFLQCLAVLALSLLAAGHGLAQGKDARIALVIGNSTYTNVTPLKNAVADAEAVADSLGKLGFSVVKTTNATRGQMNEAIGAFLDQAGPSADAVIYFAGHGVELAGANYLLPIDVPGLKPGQERLLRAESISLTELLLELEGRHSRVSIVILDACRDNPFPPQGTRSLGSTRGLARVDPPAGAFVVFSAGAGEQALDVLGPEDKNPNGVFTRRFLALINEPGMELRQMTLRLRADVTALARSINHRQVPSYYDQMTGSFFFKPGEAPTQQVASAPVPATATPAAPAVPAPVKMIDFRPGPFFINPRLNGKPLAWCRSEGRDCGFPAADEYCRRLKAPSARIIASGKVHESRYIGDDQTCSGVNCAAFSRIHCLPADSVNVLPRGYEALLHERQYFNTDCKSLGVTDIIVTKKPVGGEIIARQMPTKVITASGPYASCNGKELPGVRVFFKADPGFSGPVRAEFSSRNGGQGEMLVVMDLEVQK